MQRFVDDAALGQYVADAIAQFLRHKPDALLCIAAGTSSIPVFDALLAMKREGKVDFSQTAFLGMDEWCSIAQEADGAMADFLRRHFLNAAGFAEVFLFDGLAEPEAECVRAETFLAAHGGLDVIVFGIGVNGHVALNEPGVDPNLRTHIAAVAEKTASVAQKYFAHAAPPLTQGVTIGIQNAAEAGRIFLIANTALKRTAVEATARCVEAMEARADLPASFIAMLPQAEFLVTEAVFA